MSRPTIDALEAYHEASRALRDATPGSSDWIRLRMIVGERRAEYDSRLEADARAIREHGTITAGDGEGLTRALASGRRSRG